MPRNAPEPRTTKSIIAMLYKSITSDFFPTYFTPSGTDIITPAIKE